MNQSEEQQSTTHSPFSITVTKEGQLVIRVPVSALKYLLALLGAADALALVT